MISSSFNWIGIIPCNGSTIDRSWDDLAGIADSGGSTEEVEMVLEMIHFSPFRCQFLLHIIHNGRCSISSRNWRIGFLWNPKLNASLTDTWTCSTPNDRRVFANVGLLWRLKPINNTLQGVTSVAYRQDSRMKGEVLLRDGMLLLRQPVVLSPLGLEESSLINSDSTPTSPKR